MNTSRTLNIVLSIVAIIIGLLALIMPKTLIKIIVVILGIYSIISGIYCIAKIRTKLSDPEFQLIVTIRGTVGVAIGLLAVLLPLIFADTLWTFMVYFLAIYLIIVSGFELYAAIKMKNAGLETKSYMTEIVISILIGILLFFIPPKTFGEIIVRILGGLIFLVGVAFLIVAIRKKPLVVYAEEVPDDPNDVQS